MYNVFIKKFKISVKKSSKIYIAGHKGMVGSAIVRKLENEGYKNLVMRSSTELDLKDQIKVRDFFKEEKPEYVFLAAAKVGGILANKSYPGDFIYENLSIQNNVIHNSYLYGVKKLLFMGSSCIYPKFAPQPLKEKYILTGPLENSNEPYSIAKIAGIKMCESYFKQYGCIFFSVMPTNLYGFNDNYHQDNSHVLPALIRRMHEAKINCEKEVIIWGSGSPLREFMFADDLAEASFFLMMNYNDKDLINIGTGQELTIHELALLIKRVVGFGGNLVFDNTKPDGTPRKLLDVSKINSLGWKHKIILEDGIKLVYSDFCKNHFRTY
jgi:GDP-L-fucose synthase